jgi:RNA polymerase sigma-70 factor (ECF subfamily)
LDDHDLIKAFQSGDESAFAELVSRHRRQVYRVARGILRNHEQADDAAQETFVKAWQALAQFRGDASFKTWVYRIAMNTAFDIRSREAVRQRTLDESAREGRSEILRMHAPRPIDELIRDEVGAGVREAVAKLPDRQRVTMQLKVFEGLKYTEIAEVLDCPVGTAKANMHHAVQNLRRHLGADRHAERSDGATERADLGELAGDIHEP